MNYDRKKFYSTCPSQLVHFIKVAGRFGQVYLSRTIYTLDGQKFKKIMGKIKRKRTDHNLIKKFPYKILK
jgi:hypothetical protein